MKTIPEEKDEEKDASEERDKRPEPEANEQGGSLFDQMNQFLKKKRRTMAEQEKLEQKQGTSRFRIL